MTAKLSVSFIIRGFNCEPERVSELLSMKPTRSWRAGEAVPRTAMRRKESAWVLDSPLEDHVDIQPHIQWLLDVLPLSLDSLAALTPGWRCTVFCAVYANSERPAISLEPMHVARIANLGAGLDIDLYSIAEDE